jgi:hypothetical protein
MGGAVVLFKDSPNGTGETFQPEKQIYNIIVSRLKNGTEFSAHTAV